MLRNGTYLGKTERWEKVIIRGKYCDNIGLTMELTTVMSTDRHFEFTTPSAITADEYPPP